MGTYYDAFAPFVFKEHWTLKLVLWPRRCSISNKLLWMTYAYNQEKTWREDVYIHTISTRRWHGSIEHIMYLIKKESI